MERLGSLNSQRYHPVGFVTLVVGKHLARRLGDVVVWLQLQGLRVCVPERKQSSVKHDLGSNLTLIVDVPHKQRLAFGKHNLPATFAVCGRPIRLECPLVFLEVYVSEAMAA